MNNLKRSLIRLKHNSHSSRFVQLLKRILDLNFLRKLMKRGIIQLSSIIHNRNIFIAVFWKKKIKLQNQVECSTVWSRQRDKKFRYFCGEH